MIQTPQRRRGRPKQALGDTPSPDQILAQAALLFLSSGYEGVSVDEVARHCNVTKATIYYHFSNKSTLFTKSMLQILERVTNRVEAILESDGSLYDRLFQVTVQRIRAQAQHFNFQSMLLEAQSMLTDEQEKAMREADERIVRAIADAISRAVATEEIAVEDTYLAAHLYMSVLPIGRAKNEHGDLLFGEPEEAAKKILDLVWRGFQGQRPRA